MEPNKKGRNPMTNTIRTLETLSNMMSSRKNKLDALPDATLTLIQDTLDRVIDHLKAETRSQERPNPLDLDAEEAKNRGIITQIETLTDVMNRLKKRFDKAVVKQDYTQELNELVENMCHVGWHVAMIHSNANGNR